MKLSLLAKSCPGLVALITNLIKSSDPPKKLQDKLDDSNF